jgi:hypothetical protein
MLDQQSTGPQFGHLLAVHAGLLLRFAGHRE